MLITNMTRWGYFMFLLVAFEGLEGNGEQVFDATTVYDVKNVAINERTSRIDIPGVVQKRTNALGLDLYFRGTKHPTHADKPSLSCDVGQNCDWDLAGWPELYPEVKLESLKSEVIPVSTGFDLRFERKHYSKQHNNDLYLIFTNYDHNLRGHSGQVVVELLFEGDRNSKVWYKCEVRQQSYGYYNSWQITDRDGSSGSFKLYCGENYSNRFMINASSTLRFEVDRNVKIFLDGAVYPSVDLGDRGSQMTYLSIHSWWNPTSLKPLIRKTHFKTPDNGSVIVSPAFVPWAKQLCLVLVVYCSSELKQTVLQVSAKDPNELEHLLFKINDFKAGWQVKHINIKAELKIGTPWKLVIRKVIPVEIRISKITRCECDDAELSILSNDYYFSGKLKNNLFAYTATPEMIPIETTDDTCLNGGVLTTSGCACSPGFAGSQCQNGCGRNRFGHDCGGRCSFRSRGCEQFILCTEFTGCQCGPGYTGDMCNATCPDNFYGNDCLQICGHCAEREVCDKYTGKCRACALGYVPPFCKQEFVYYSRQPELVSEQHETITVTFDLRDGVKGFGEPKLYQVQYREKGQNWTLHTSKTIPKSDNEDDETSYEEGSIKEIIDGLKSGVVYEVRILLTDVSYNKYDGDLIKLSEVLTKCDTPEDYDYNVQSSSNHTSFTFTWTYELGNKHWCPVEGYEVSWRENYQWKTDVTKEPTYFLSDFEPGLEILFRVRVNTSGGYAPYSKNTSISTIYLGTGPVDNLRMVSSHSTSLDISWNPPADSDGRQLKYKLTYKCVNQVACSPGCKDATEGHITQEGTSVNLSALLPFTQYLVTVTPESGPASQLYVGTSEVAPTEIPILSEQKPLRSNTSVTVYWDPVSVCSSFAQGYTYQLTKASESLKMLSSGFTKETSMSFYNLTASTDYVVKVFVNTVAGWNPDAFLPINISTSATVPEAVRNLTVYKRGRNMLGLRWAEPRTLYGKLKSFTVQYSLGKEATSVTVEPTQCTVWPQLYCHTLENLKSNRKYNVMVSARNEDLNEDGVIASVAALTKESAPLPPESLKVLNSSSTSVGLQWKHPDLANGVLRSFLVNVEESEKFDQDSCCQVYPLVEILVKEENQLYEVEVSGLHPASTYYMSVSAKTVSLGPSQSLVVNTRPPHLPFSVLPVWNTIQLADNGEGTPVNQVEWLPQSHLSELNVSDIYTPLVKAHIVLLAVNGTNESFDTSGSGILDKQLLSLLQQYFTGRFYFLREYSGEDIIPDSVWGEILQGFQLSSGMNYQLIAVQITDYNGVYNIDMRHSSPYTQP